MQPPISRSTTSPVSRRLRLCVEWRMPERPARRDDGREAHILAARSHDRLRRRGRHVVVGCALAAPRRWRPSCQRRSSARRRGCARSPVDDFTVLTASTMADPSTNCALSEGRRRGCRTSPPGDRCLPFPRPPLRAVQPLVPKRVGDVLLLTPAGCVAAAVVEPCMDERASQLRRRHKQRRIALQRHDHALARVRRKRLVPRQIQHVRRMLHDQHLDVPLAHPHTNLSQPSLVLRNRKRRLLWEPIQHFEGGASAGDGGVNFHALRPFVWGSSVSLRLRILSYVTRSAASPRETTLNGIIDSRLFNNGQ